MKLHLVDGTYELFRSFYGAPSRRAPDGREVGAVAGLARSLLSLITRSGATHIGIAFDHVIESFRNDLFSEYKTGEGLDPDLLSQFSLAEVISGALGLVVWPMVEFEADDALASAAARFRRAPEVEQVILCSPDKDLAQMVDGTRVVCWDRRRDRIYDEPGVMAKYGVPPESIPDWLALVGDASDGYPGIAGWGAKSAAAVLTRFAHLDDIPPDPTQWGMSASRARRLAESLSENLPQARLYRQLATLRLDVPIEQELGDLEWRGATPRLRELCRELGDPGLLERVPRWAGA